jgi:hypothetical protein
LRYFMDSAQRRRHSSLHQYPKIKIRTTVLDQAPLPGLFQPHAGRPSGPPKGSFEKTEFLRIASAWRRIAGQQVD